ncbi:hypothetical protein CROQUDRAFT_651244 [Cronartium quercuum f. sp. fusiforme G11]|uniref:Uncharacterized protein n=1 Tax=Cronartium quercuum f. sp. fusiforme G11 TaxID=708437 RepID=A0A9P6NQB5_9BASI|nr:hypothetical protein CROQUDRAFT_651244 [Cronartium quercuum f. sp. fusiforme G11]
MDPTSNFSSPTASPAAHHIVLSAPATKLTFSPLPVTKEDEQPFRRRTTSPVQKTPYPSISTRPPITERKPSLSHLLELYDPPPPVFEVLNRGQFRRKSMNTTRSGSVESEKVEEVHIKHEEEDEDERRSSSSGPTGSIYSSEVETGCR